MKHRVLAYVAGGLGGVGLTASFAEPAVSAPGGNTGPTATIAVTCRGTGDLFVNYTYSGVTGAVRGVDLHVGKMGAFVDPAKGRSGQVVQAFNQTAVGTPINWGTVGAELVSHTGKVIGGSAHGWGARA